MNKYIITLKGTAGANYLFPVKGDERMVRVWQGAGFTVSKKLGRIPFWFFVDGRIISLKRKLKWLETLHQAWKTISVA